ncbi:hypothetical protein GQ43DRAFT_252932 [Delitschia confertaspora ATCC 74209]|uniref:Copper homeostasis protein cutC homolog n=1 Tax=Delitschia confertaspora ATCC 74209 TaxID=1513339 RepID=A0A9P4JHC3_9PLEO|nr:hypothetical protein GQ43DRAFT_252932 [Delitschia confertaspora ATCC 74209]
MLEIACFNPSSVLAASRSGADRIEFCANYSLGGITPSLNALRNLRAEIPIPIYIMIRPRGGDFVYSDAEFNRMKSDIEAFKAAGADGFVFGILDHGRGVDAGRNRELVELARPTQCTFHRAIDLVENLEGAVEIVVGCGFAAILTSGGQENAVQGASVVAGLQRRFGERIGFILGGGVRAENAGELEGRTGVGWLHSAAITGEAENVNEEEIRRIREALKS